MLYFTQFGYYAFISIVCLLPFIRRDEGVCAMNSPSSSPVVGFSEARHWWFYLAVGEGEAERPPWTLFASAILLHFIVFFRSFTYSSTLFFLFFVYPSWSIRFGQLFKFYKFTSDFLHFSLLCFTFLLFLFFLRSSFFISYLPFSLLFSLVLSLTSFICLHFPAYSPSAFPQLFFVCPLPLLSLMPLSLSSPSLVSAS